MLSGTLSVDDAGASPYMIDVTAHDPHEASAYTSMQLIVHRSGLPQTTKHHAVFRRGAQAPFF